LRRWFSASSSGRYRSLFYLLEVTFPVTRQRQIVGLGESKPSILFLLESFPGTWRSPRYSELVFFSPADAIIFVIVLDEDVRPMYWHLLGHLRISMLVFNYYQARAGGRVDGFRPQRRVFRMAPGPPTLPGVNRLRRSFNSSSPDSFA